MIRKQARRTGRRYPAKRYAAQRRLGFVWLRFLPELEDEFAVYSSAVRRRRALALALLGILACVSFVYDDLLAHLGIVTFEGYLFLILSVLAASCTVVAYKMGLSGTRLQTAVLINILVFNIGVVGATMSNALANPDVPYEADLITVIGIYFSSGLTFYRNVVCGTTVVVLYILGIVALHIHRPAFPIEVQYLISMNVLGMMGNYYIEYSERTAFLFQKELERLAMIDELTGLLNRRAFFQHLNMVWKLAQRQDGRIAVAMIDLDFLKKINDGHGHHAGDLCFKLLAKTVNRNVRRPLDAVGRIGGDEFIATWFDPQPEWLEGMLERLRTDIADGSQDNPGAPPFTVSIGAGIISVGRDLTASAFCKLVDENLYEAKHSGRNRVVSTRHLRNVTRMASLPRTAQIKRL